MTPKQEEALRDYLQEAIVPLIEQVLVKKLGQAMAFAAQEVVSPQRKPQQDCTRSHPHENMDAMCELRTEIARLANENARLKAQPQQEPVGWRLSNEAFDYQITSYDEEQANTYIKNGWHLIDVLYTSPPAQRKPLTDEEIEAVWKRVQANDFHDCVQPFARAIESAHGIKENT